LALLPASATAQLVAVDRTNQEVVELDTRTGQGVVLGPIPPKEDPYDLTYHAPGSQFIGVATDWKDMQLFGIDAATWEFTVIRNYPGFDWIWLAIEYYPPGDTLYAIRANVATHDTDLYVIDPATGDFTWVGDLPFYKVGGMAYDPVSGLMYVTAGIHYPSMLELHTINVETGESVFIGELHGAELSTSLAIVCHPTAGLLCIDSGQSKESEDYLYVVDRATAFVTLVGPTGQPTIVGMAFRPSCAADVNGDGALDILDFIAFQQLWQAADPTADCDDSAQFNVLDYVCFQQLFVAGCS
jgi:hypothetical protein